MYRQEIEKANTLLEALPYIKKFRGKLLVVKFGGSVMFDDELKSSGQLLYAQAVQSVQTATTGRVRNGRATTQDGPFTETKEVLGGFILIEVRDLNEAIQVATRMPAARVGSVEVRPVLEL